MKYMLAGVVATVLMIVGALYYKLGMYKEVHVTDMAFGPVRQVYKLHVGAYYKILPTILEVEKWAKEKGETCENSFGEYLDNPKAVDEDRLQSNGGCIVNGDYSKEKLPEGFFYREIPKQDYVMAIFDGSPSVAPYKVYPKALEYFQKKTGHEFTGHITEVYRVLSDRAVETRYYLPVVP